MLIKRVIVVEGGGEFGRLFLGGCDEVDWRWTPYPRFDHVYKHLDPDSLPHRVGMSRGRGSRACSIVMAGHQAARGNGGSRWTMCVVAKRTVIRNKDEGRGRRGKQNALSDFCRVSSRQQGVASVNKGCQVQDGRRTPQRRGTGMPAGWWRGRSDGSSEGGFGGLRLSRRLSVQRGPDGRFWRWAFRHNTQSSAGFLQARLPKVERGSGLSSSEARSRFAGARDGSRIVAVAWVREEKLRQAERGPGAER